MDRTVSSNHYLFTSIRVSLDCNKQCSSVNGQPRGENEQVDIYLRCYLHYVVQFASYQDMLREVLKIIRT